MNIYKWADQTFLCGHYEYFFLSDPGVLPAGWQLPNIREISIQINKWKRMLDRNALIRETSSNTAKRLKLTPMTKKELLKEGRLSTQTMQQSRKVQRLLSESIWQLFREYDVRRGQKPRTKQEFAEFWKMWEALMWEHRREFFKKMSKKLPPIQKAELRKLASSARRLRTLTSS